MPEPRFIAIEGPIGVGKTSLARLLAEELDARLLVEQVEDNPFLKKFYESRREYAFQAQIFFLLSRYRAQLASRQADLFKQVTVADYLLDKDRLFARINLLDDEFALYEQIYALLGPRTPRPDLVVYLQASPKRLVERIRKRGKDYERGIDPSYLERLCEVYNQHFFYYTAGPLLVVNTDHIDFIANRGDFMELKKEILACKGGITYFNPLGSR